MLHAEARRRARRDARRRIRAARRAGSGAVGLADDRRGRGAAAARQRSGRHRPLPARRRAAVGARLSPPHAATPTGRRSCSSTTRCWRSPARRSSRSIAPWRSRSCGRRRRARGAATRSPPTRGSPNTSPTGQRARSCWPRRGARGEAPRLRDRDRPRARPGGPPLPAAAGGAAGLTVTLHRLIQHLGIALSIFMRCTSSSAPKPVRPVAATVAAKQ